MSKPIPDRADAAVVLHGRVALDPANEKPFRAALKPRGCTVQLMRGYWPYWRVEETATGRLQQVGFDVDVRRIIEQLGEGRTLQFIDLYTARPKPGDTATPQLDATNSACCLACGKSGGLPCPKMIAQGLKLGVVFKFGRDDPQTGHAHLHPGKCRAWLRKALDAAVSSGTIKKEPLNVIR